MIMWEVYTQIKPFANRLTQFQVQTFLCAGNRPLLPNDCPKFLSDLIEDCWNQDPLKRPEFKEISALLEENLQYRHISGLNAYAPVNDIAVVPQAPYLQTTMRMKSSMNM